MSDLDQLMAVMEAAFDPHWREAWTRSQVENSLAMPNTYALLCDADGHPLEDGRKAAGFVLVRRAPGEEELLLVAVDPDLRRKGLGRSLLELFFAQARSHGAERVFLEMRSNNPALTLYESVGFNPIGRRRAYYRTATGEALDAITFGKNL
ncbi:ribosomal protein S18-alanine N-acetyltransferase [Qipengyuania proteolytica]|uniref:ribosomal protein S18-alanine N-acetyltransferase n=1 Tax=Qipengyuania proteolytica TaxID=2867239 RepID=UPI001FFCC880|nr:ribosomal protein S18-alanine N-acetyltransferase [Qipengyuania proteolytica]